MREKVPRRLVVGITGATGAVYGIRLLQTLETAHVESHLVVSRWGARTLIHETPHSLAEVKARWDPGNLFRANKNIAVSA